MGEAGGPSSPARREDRMLGRIFLRLLLAAAAWSVVVIRQSPQADDGGPPLGALCMAVPALLLVGAGAAWPRRAKPR